MNLPTSQTNPDGFTNLPPNQKRRLRLMIRSASASEIYSFLHDDLQPKTALNPVYFAMLALSLLLVGAALAANSPLLLLAALLCAPFNSPLMGLTLSAVIPSWALMLRSFAALLLTAAAYFGAGWLSARLTSGGKLPFLHLLQHGWLEWTVLAVGSALLAAMLIRQRETPRLASALVTALVFFPLGLAGWALQTGSPYASSGLLQLCAAYAAAALLVALITFWAAGLPPRKGAGWVLFVLALGLTALTLFGFLSSQHHLSQAIALNTTPPPVGSPTRPGVSQPPTQTPLPPTATKPAPTSAVQNPVITILPSITPTPTLVSALIRSDTGVIVRAEPSSAASVVTYLNDLSELVLLGEQAQKDGVLWEKVRLPDGKIGWVAARFLITATPAK
ncbi:MAG: SH3 domain-containing protein [Anaerolineales bacterium]|nr:SH3 domain-containing protein [Anaerolineales bacterium]